MTRETEVGVLLHRFRTDAGLSQEVLAERAGLSSRGISDIERGLKTRPHLHTLLRLADALDLSLADRDLLKRAARPVSAPGELEPPESPVSGNTEFSPRVRESVHPGRRPEGDGRRERTNLGDEPTRFIGREREIEAISALLAQPGVRLVTLTGVGGIGKTRLARRVGARLFDRFEDGVFFVPLAPIADPDLVVPTIAAVIGMERREGKPFPQALLEYLETRRLLLVLDNLEHLLDAAPLVATLLETCPNLRVLATSRSLLHLAREHAYEVPPLALPEPGQDLTVELLARADAVALFVERARAARYGFTLTNENALSVATICERLDALPLAIELAAARVRILSPEALVHRLENRLQLLTGGPRDLPARHQTLSASIDWSCELLTLGEQALFRRLAIFVGGWTLEAADAVRDGEIDVLEGLSALAENSLIQRAEGVGGEPRFMMLETIRESGLQRLEQHGEMDEVGALYAAFYVSIGAQAQEELGGSQAHIWMERLELDLSNVRASLAWTRDHGEITLMLRLASSLFLFWERHDHAREGIEWLEEALARAHDAPPLVRAAALKAQAFLMCGIDIDPDRTCKLFKESLQLYRNSESDEAGTAQALQGLGLATTWRLGDRKGAKPLFEESLAIWRRLGAEASIGVVLCNLGEMALGEGDLDRAQECLQEALEHARNGSDTWVIGVCLRDLGSVAATQGDHNRAETLWRDALAAFQEIGDRRFITFTLQQVVERALEVRDAERAVRILAVIQSIRNHLDFVRPEWLQECSEHARSGLSAQEWTEAWNDGSSMTFDEGIEYLLRAGVSNRP